MARVSPIQESFAYGEIDPRVRGRVSTDAYRGGLKRSRNWYPLVQGPIRTREGSRFLTPVDNLNWTTGDTSTSGLRLITFQRSLDNDALFEIGINELIGRDGLDGAGLVQGQSTNLILDSRYCTAIPGTYFTFNPDKYPQGLGTPAVFRGRAGACTDFAYAYWTAFADGVADTMAGPALESNTGFGAIIIPAGSELLTNTWTIPYVWNMSPADIAIIEAGGFTELSVRTRVGTAPGLGDVLDDTDIFGAPNTDIVLTKNFVPGATNNTLYLSVGFEWTGPANLPVFDDGRVTFFLKIMTYTATLTGAAGGGVTFATPWSAAQMEELQWCQDPGEAFGVFTHPNVEPYVLKYVAPDYIFQVISAEAGFVAPTGSVWAAGDYPRACEFHEGRLWLGGSPSFPNALWASRSGVYVDFDAAGPTTKADPLLFALSNSGEVQTLTSRKELVVNTDVSEIIGTSVAGVIAFDDFAFPKQTDWGSNHIQTMKVGRDMVFTSNSRRRSRTFSDEGGTNFGWDGNELTLLANDIFKAGVRRMVYLDEPGYQAIFLLDDGTIGAATFFYPENAIGWWRMTTAYNGATPDEPGLGNQDPNNDQPTNNIMDITRVNTSAGAQLAMLINRIGYVGTQKVGIEMMAFDTEARHAMDGWVARQPYEVFADGILRVDDVSHLTDQSLAVVVEQEDPATGDLYWAVHPKVTVIANNSSPLEEWVRGGVVYIGYQYDNDIQLLSLEGVSNRGSSQSSKRRWNKVFARLNRSPVPLIEGIPAKDRTPATPMGLGEPMITGDTEIVDLGSGEGDLVITQDKPLITEITGIFGKVQSQEI